ncbi:MAG: folylpolyglutamate synthase/dihydrofolate synthase family protein [Bacteroidota bacterium]
MTYQETLNYMFSQLPMYQRIGSAAYKANLDNTIALDTILFHPHKNFKSIHIAGTNGKGSTSHFLASILQEAGYKVGLYTSPHLIDYRERIKINGEMIDKEYVIRFIEENQLHFIKIQPSFFEMSVALAFNYFSDKNIDIAVIETGLGGRLDSTNIITPLLSIITNIGLDHTQFLGHTHTEIAKEKGGIIKKSIPVVIGESQSETKSVFELIAKEKESDIIFADKKVKIINECISYQKGILSGDFIMNEINYQIESPLIGLYQYKNIKTVLLACDELKKQNIILKTSTIEVGIRNVIKNTDFKGRWQVIQQNPVIICDIGHNADGIKANMLQLEKIPYKNLHMVIGVVNDKDVDSMMELLPKVARYYYCKASIPRALDEKILAKKGLAKQKEGEAFATVKLAIESAKIAAKEDDLIYIGGSAFVVSDALEYFENN